MGTCANRLKCDRLEWMKINILRWFGHIKSKNSEEFVKKVYVSEIVGPRRRGRPVVFMYSQVNDGKSKVMFFEREVEVDDFDRVSVTAIGRCEIVLRREKMEEVKEFKYLGTVLCKHGEMEREIRKSLVKGRCVMITCKGYERKECVHGGKEIFKEQYSSANIDIWIKDLDMEWVTTVKSACCGYYLSKRRMRHGQKYGKLENISHFSIKKQCKQ